MIVVRIEAEGVGQWVGPFASEGEADAWIRDGWGEDPADVEEVKVKVLSKEEASAIAVSLIAP